VAVMRRTKRPQAVEGGHIPRQALSYYPVLQQPVGQDTKNRLRYAVEEAEVPECRLSFVAVFVVLLFFPGKGLDPLRRVPEPL